MRSMFALGFLVLAGCSGSEVIGPGGDGGSVSGRFRDADQKHLIFDSRELALSIEHKLDVDPDGGCVGGLALEGNLVEGGCFVSLRMATGTDGAFRLVHAEFTADSFCPGWGDDEEGVYVFGDGLARGRVQLPAQVDSGALVEVVDPVGLTLSFQTCFAGATHNLKVEVEGVTQPVVSTGVAAMTCPLVTPSVIEQGTYEWCDVDHFGN